MSLPDAWVDRIFEKLTLTYGRQFLNRWEGVDIKAVKDDWAHELRGYAQSPHAIAHGLANLPVDKAPTVLEFRQLCRQSPPKPAPALAPAAPADPAKVAEAIGRISKPDPHHPRAWAWRLRERERGGASLTKAQQEFWREALRSDLAAEQAAQQVPA